MPPSNSGRARANRWVQLLAGIACMVMIANLQYGWTLFVHPMREKFGWDRSAIQVAFTLFVLVETGVVPFEGWIVDRFGPKRVVLAGGLLVGLAWGLNSIADSLPLLYLGAVLGGIGAGGVFGTCIGNALKWFPDRRGLAAGLTAAGYGLGSAFTIVPIQRTIEAHGYQAAFLWFGIAQGVVVCLASLMLEAPRQGQAPAPSAGLQPATRDFAPKEVLRSPLFWLLYVMFVLVSAGGLTFTAQLAPIAIDFDVAGVPVSLLGITLPALTFALTIDRITNGLTRPLCGWVSDHIGRETTMFIAFALEAVGIWALGDLGPRSADVRAAGRGGLLRLGRGRQPVSGDLHRLLRHPVRHDQRRPALYGQGHRLAAGPARQPAGGGNGPLARGVRDRRADERRGGGAGHCRAAAVAAGLGARPGPIAAGRRPATPRAGNCSPTVAKRREETTVLKNERAGRGL